MVVIISHLLSIGSAGRVGRLHCLLNAVEIMEAEISFVDEKRW
jgi:hypothetical protein